MINKIINSDDPKFQSETISELVFDTTPTVNSFNAVTSDGVARAIAGASGEVPQVTDNDNGKVLTAVYDAGGPAVEWAEAPSGLPDTTGASQGDVLTIGSSGAEWAAVPTELPASLGTAGQVLTVNSGATGVEWATAQSGSSYTAGAGIEISQQDAISVSTDNATLDFDVVDTTLTSSAFPTAQFTPTVSLAETNTCTLKLVPDSTNIYVYAPAEAAGKRMVCRLRSVKDSTTFTANPRDGMCFFNNNSVYFFPTLPGPYLISNTLVLKDFYESAPTTFNQFFYTPLPITATWDDVLSEDFYVEFGYLDNDTPRFGDLTLSGGHVEIVTDAGAHSSLKVKNPLPAYNSTTDEGKVLQIVSGVPTWVTP